MKKKTDMAPLHWTTQAQFYATVQKDGRTLSMFIGVSTSFWYANAVETPTDVLQGSIEDVFDDHAHKVIGRYYSPDAAFKACESFSVAWLKGFKQTRSEQCECDDIPAPQATKKSGVRTKKSGIRTKKK